MLIFGAGGHGQSVAEAAKLNGLFEVVGFVDDALAECTLVLGYDVLGPAVNLTGYALACDQVVMAIRNNALRASLADRLLKEGLSLAIVVHPKAMISPSAQLGAGSAVMAGAVLGTEAVLGQGVIVNCCAVVDHHARVEDFGRLGVGACMVGCSVLGAKACLQAGSVIGYGVNVAAGEVLPPGTTRDRGDMP